jgi:hypothetical protein
VFGEVLVVGMNGADDVAVNGWLMWGMKVRRGAATRVFEDSSANVSGLL